MRYLSRSLPSLLRTAVGFIVAGIIATTTAEAGVAGWYENGLVQVRLAPGVYIEDINVDYDTTTFDQLDPMYLLEVAEGSDEWQVLNAMQGDARLEWFEVAYLNDTPEAVRMMVVGVVGGTIEDYEDQDVVNRLNLPFLHTYETGDGIIVGLVDTGVNYNHLALTGHIIGGGIDYVDGDNDPFDSANGFDDDGDGLVDEGAGHGTMVAGTIALAAPGASILPIRALDDEGQGRSFDLAKGIRYAVENGADIINLSAGLFQSCNVIESEVLAAHAAGVVIVGASGNSGTNLPAFFPANMDEVLGVAAVDEFDIKADFSSYHPCVSISAPGVGIRGPFLDDGWAVGAGTSFAAPFVAGQAAIVRAALPSLQVEEVMDIVQNGFTAIYHIPENHPYLDELGLGRFDGVAAWNAIQTPTDVDNPIDAGGLTDVSELTRLTVSPNPSPNDRVVQLRMAVGNAARRDASSGTWEIVDALGRRAATVPTTIEAGVQHASWDGRDDAGNVLPAGVYWLRTDVTGPAARIVRVQP